MTNFLLELSLKRVTTLNFVAGKRAIIFVIGENLYAINIKLRERGRGAIGFLNNIYKSFSTKSIFFF